ncbi:MAG: hypothetical protein LAO04_06360 [Acidobacteriia bacterium]|nr:hypothetical protein [Terriglobia bacterium]
MPFVLIIRERGCSWAGRDPIATIHSSREEALAELVDYVWENWDAKMDEAPPEDDDELIDQYFDNVLEEYVIAEASYAAPTGKTVSEH